MNVYAQIESSRLFEMYEYQEEHFKEEDSLEDRVAIARHTVSDALVEQGRTARRIFAVIDGDKK